MTDSEGINPQDGRGRSEGVRYHGAHEVLSVVRKIISETEEGALVPMSTNIMIQRLIDEEGMAQARAVKLPSQIRKGAPLSAEWKQAFVCKKFLQRLGRTSNSMSLPDAYQQRLLRSFFLNRERREQKELEQRERFIQQHQKPTVSSGISPLAFSFLNQRTLSMIQAQGSNHLPLCNLPHESQRMNQSGAKPQFGRLREHPDFNSRPQESKSNHLTQPKKQSLERSATGPPPVSHKLHPHRALVPQFFPPPPPPPSQAPPILLNMVPRSSNSYHFKEGTSTNFMRQTMPNHNYYGAQFQYANPFIEQRFNEEYYQQPDYHHHPGVCFYDQYGHIQTGFSMSSSEVPQNIPGYFKDQLDGNETHPLVSILKRPIGEADKQAHPTNLDQMGEDWANQSRSSKSVTFQLSDHSHKRFKQSPPLSSSQSSRLNKQEILKMNADNYVFPTPRDQSRSPPLGFEGTAINEEEPHHSNCPLSKTHKVGLPPPPSEPVRTVGAAANALLSLATPT